ncbi:MAG: hypothetical protein JOZ57_01150, partial [Abitibacteriaceae bacterium]|nr:hypothetical protein [Abditibacteriaceae bacterium]
MSHATHRYCLKNSLIQIVSFLLMLLALKSAHATLLYYEGFDYPGETPLANAKAGTGWAGDGWAGTNGLWEVARDDAPGAKGLAFGDLQVTGRAALNTAFPERTGGSAGFPSRNFTTPINLRDTTKTFYFSSLARIERFTTGNTFASLGRSPNHDALAVQTPFQNAPAPNPGTWQLGNISGEHQTAPIAFGQTVFSLIRLHYDGIQLKGEWWLYNQPNTLPASDPTGGQGGAAAYARFTSDETTLPGLSFGGFGYQMVIDEVRGATTLAEAVPLQLARLSGVLVQPSVQQKALTINVELTGVRQAGEVSVTVDVLDAQGKVEKSFSGHAPVQATHYQVVPITWDWANPRLWDLGQPNLYTLKLHINSSAGVGINQDFTTRFGFREVWVEGRRIMLNGHEVHFRPINFGYGGGPGQAPVDQFKKLQDQGFNLLEIWPGEGDFHQMNAATAEVADQLGIGVAGAAPFIKDEGSAAYHQKLEEQLSDLRNHPSILLWGSSGNRYLDANDQDPRVIGRRDWTHVQEIQERNQKGMEAIKVLKAYDPTRPTFTHAGNYVGDIYTLNNYLDFLPLQEREDWLSQWAANAEMPLFSVEFGTPLYTTYLRGRNDYGRTIATEPFSTEWAAVYFGSEAYRMESDAYRQAIRSRFKEGQTYNAWIGDKELHNDPTFLATQKLFITNTWRSWRTWGISGGMVPWENANGHPELVQPVNRPTLAYIAGPPQEFTAKDHNFSTSATIHKSIVLLNDASKAQTFDVRWEVSVDGHHVGGNQAQGTLEIAEKRFVPITFNAPAAVAAGKGQITMTAMIGNDRHQDTFDFHVLAPPTRARGTLTVFDLNGDTSAMLKNLGYTVQPLNPRSNALPQGVVVIGRRALSGNAVSDLGQLPFDVAAFVRNGGRLIIFGQDPRWMQYALGIRTTKSLTRHVFPVVANHPVMAHLQATDLADWVGSSNLVGAQPSVGGVEPWFTPAYGWHWGNRGAVSSAPMEKPHRTSWRPILECEFDLAYAPLMEMDYGQGRVTLCTLDLEDHINNDAAAHTLAANLMNYVINAPLTPKAQSVLYVGDASGASLLDFMGVVYTKATSVTPTAGLVILGPGASEAGVQEYVRHGGKVLYLPRDQSGGGVTIGTAKNFGGSLHPPAWPETAGLSLSDLHWRSFADASVITAGDAGIEIGADGLLARQKVGNGVIIHCQLDPTSLPADKQTYFRFTRWRQTRALAQVLSNLGATFQQDTRQLELIRQPA